LGLTALLLYLLSGLSLLFALWACCCCGLLLLRLLLYLAEPLLRALLLLLLRLLPLYVTGGAGPL
jgi:hypothetical protein